MREFKRVAGRFFLISLLPMTQVILPNLAQAQLEEVVVTARAREESLQDVPATVTAFTEGQIENMGVQRAEDFVI